MEIKNLTRPVLRFLGYKLLGVVVTVLCRTLKIHNDMPEATQKLLNSGDNFIVGFWHGTMLAPWFVLRNRPMSAIVSQSKDGELLNKVLEKWKYNVIRGSSSRGGKDALLSMIRTAQKGFTVAVTPDGPTGPALNMKPGVVITAKKTNKPLVLIGVGNKNRWQFKSWDKFEMPKFFSEVKLVYSEPINIDPDLSYDDTDKLIKDCEHELLNLQRKAAL